MKKILFCKIILLFLLMIVIFNRKAYATNNDFIYELDSNNIAIITAYKGSSSNITIPSTIDGHEVKKIANHAFDESRNSTNGKILTNVIISEGITTVGDFAFIDCTNLESVTLPETLTSLGVQTFVGCTKLNKINIPSNLHQLSSDVFHETAFTEFVIPENIEFIRSCAFRLCKQLKSFKVYSKDVVYDNRVFEFCSEDLVLYGYEGSTTQTYAEQNGLNFRILSDETEDVPVTSITLNKTSLSLNIGDSETLTATISPTNATDKSLIWMSSNTNIAIVEDGKITAKNSGSAVISVSTLDGTIKATCDVTVMKKGESSNPINIPVTSITLNKTSLSLNIGDSETLVATILPNNATDKKLNWTSSNLNVATVENGKVIAKNAGSTIISVSTPDGTKKATCNVAVLKKSDYSENLVDNTIAKTILPKTGTTNFIRIILIGLCVIMFILYNSYKKLK